MSKPFEELTKDLASGVSRRKAFVRFGAGLGAALAGLVFRRPARAAGRGEVCVHICRDIFQLEGAEFGHCVSDCVRGRIPINYIDS